MQSSDRLNTLKNNIEIVGKIDSLHRKINSIKLDIDNLRESFSEHISCHKKSIKELYAFCNKLEEIYFNGLTNTNSNSNVGNISMSDSEVDNSPSLKYTISDQEVFDIKPIFNAGSTSYDNLSSN